VDGAPLTALFAQPLASLTLVNLKGTEAEKSIQGKRARTISNRPREP